MLNIQLFIWKIVTKNRVKITVANDFVKTVRCQRKHFTYVTPKDNSYYQKFTEVYLAKNQRPLITKEALHKEAQVLKGGGLKECLGQ